MISYHSARVTAQRTRNFLSFGALAGACAPACSACVRMVLMLALPALLSTILLMAFMADGADNRLLQKQHRGVTDRM